jgi:hypothetical protein
MTISTQKHAELLSTIENLYNHINIGVPDENRPLYAGYLSIDKPFYLDEDGYFVIYQSLKRAIVSIENIGDKWSNQGLEAEIHKLLLELATLKDNNVLPDLENITLGFEQKIDIEFQEYECIVPVIGLSITSMLQIGDVTFLPFDAKDRFSNTISDIQVNSLRPHADCFSTTKVNAEWIRSAELAREKVEKVLNILRFLGSLIWPSGPTRHINILGQELKRVSYTFVIDPQQKFGSVGHSESSVLPFKIDDTFMQYARFFGLSYLQSLINRQGSALEEDLFAAIQWYGFATQELNPLVSFVKFYIAVETATKREGESAKTTLPKRISIFLEPWRKSSQKELEIELGQLIDERNSVFHEGKIKNFSPSYLVDSSRTIARGVINQLRIRIESEGWKTKEDLISWVKAQSKKLSE